ncbi:MAG: hypothetical protein ACJ76Y_30945 [Thermoanaerobaculia bacterium]
MSRITDLTRSIVILLATLVLVVNAAMAQSSKTTTQKQEQSPPGTQNPTSSQTQVQPQAPAIAQSQTPAPATSSQVAQTCNESTATVKDVYQDGDNTDREVELRDTIVVEMNDLQSLVAEAKCVGRGKPQDIVLYLDGRPLMDLVAYPPTNPNQNFLKFWLRRTEASRDVWAYLLGRPSLTEPRATKVSVGLSNKYAVEADPPDGKSAIINLRVIPLSWFGFWLTLLAAFLIGFFVLAFKTDVLRDPVPQPVGDARRPYSLARTQVSWWFFLILSSYMFIGMITGDFSTSITGTVLVLMGISAGTAVSSAFVDASKSNPRITKVEFETRQKLKDEVEKLEAEIKAAESASKQVPANPSAEQDLAAKKAELETKKSQLCKVNNESEKFIQDILSDANGVNFHRFQMLAWTVVLGIIFVGHVYREMAMPDFSATLLSLMGISAGTYIGLKIPEETVPKTQD